MEGGGEEEVGAEQKEEGSPECLQISSPTLKSIEEDEEGSKEEGAENKEEEEEEEEGHRDGKGRILRKRANSPEESDRAAKQRKKSWGSLTAEAEDVVSSESLKDIVPSVSTIMEKNGGEEEEEKEEGTKDEEETKEEGEEEEDGDKKEAEGDPEDDAGAFVKVTNLVRPFTLNQLKALLGRTGEIDLEGGFYINKIKSVCVVRYLRSSSARETVSSLDKVRWPSTNPNSLRVTLTDEEEFHSLSDGGDTATATAVALGAGAGRGAAPAASGGRERKDSEASSKPPKPLEELFRSTKATPLLYWKTAVN